MAVSPPASRVTASGQCQALSLLDRRRQPFTTALPSQGSWPWVFCLDPLVPLGRCPQPSEHLHVGGSARAIEVPRGGSGAKLRGRAKSQINTQPHTSWLWTLV